MVITTDWCFAHRASEKKQDYKSLWWENTFVIREGICNARSYLHMLDPLKMKWWPSSCPLMKMPRKSFSRKLQWFLWGISSFFSPCASFWIRRRRKKIILTLQSCSLRPKGPKNTLQTQLDAGEKRSQSVQSFITNNEGAGGESSAGHAGMGLPPCTRLMPWLWAPESC